MIEIMTVNRSPSGTITLTHSKTTAGFSLASMIVFLAVWYGVLLRSPSNDWMIYLFWLAPLMLTPQVMETARAFLGLAYTFDPSSRTIKKNEEIIARFDEVYKIQIRTIHGDGSNEYRLALVLHGDRKIRLAQTTDEQRVMHAAEEIADLLSVSIHRKS